MGPGWARRGRCADSTAGPRPIRRLAHVEDRGEIGATGLGARLAPRGSGDDGCRSGVATGVRRRSPPGLGSAMPTAARRRTPSRRRRHGRRWHRSPAGRRRSPHGATGWRSSRRALAVHIAFGTVGRRESVGRCQGAVDRRCGSVGPADRIVVSPRPQGVVAARPKRERFPCFGDAPEGGDVHTGAIDRVWGLHRGVPSSGNAGRSVADSHRSSGSSIACPTHNVSVIGVNLQPEPVNFGVFRARPSRPRILGAACDRPQRRVRCPATSRGARG